MTLRRSDDFNIFNMLRDPKVAYLIGGLCGCGFDPWVLSRGYIMKFLERPFRLLSALGRVVTTVPQCTRCQFSLKTTRGSPMRKPFIVSLNTVDKLFRY